MCTGRWKVCDVGTVGPSAAFDTVDHGILLSRLSQCFGVQGSAYTWFESYPSSRSQFVQIKVTSSSDRRLTCGLPQGSVLGPILYLVYTSPLGAILRRHGVGFHMYADDTQLYLSMKTTKVEDVVSTRTWVEVCLRELNQWMLLTIFGKTMIRLSSWFCTLNIALSHH